MLKIILLAAALLLPGSAVSQSPAVYTIGEVQQFHGLVCRESDAAMHIYDTWRDEGPNASKAIFGLYRVSRKCRFLMGYHAYFIERLVGSVLPYFDGTEKNVTVYAISPGEGSEIVDYLVTWENVNGG